MIRLHVVVEGRTEEEFVARVLGPCIAGVDVFAAPIIVTTRRDRVTGRKIGRGGGHWKHWRKDICRLLLDRDTAVRVTTLFDLYGLPDDFPRIAEHARCSDTAERVSLLEQAMADDLADPRFIPYLQRHEFEALVLAGLGSLRAVLDTPEDIEGLALLRSEIGTTPPEDVEDGKETAQSKRLLRRIPSYRKTLHGPLAIEMAGLPRLRAACVRFDAWIRRLEHLAGR